VAGVPTTRYATAPSTAGRLSQRVGAVVARSADAVTHAREHQLDMNTYLVACVRWLAEQPDTVLHHVRPFSEGPSPRGRPRRDCDTATTP
jgi:hypothetical protein